MKECRGCGQFKPLVEYNKSTRAKDGKQSRCKKCQKEANASHYAANKDHVKKRVKRWATENPESVRNSKDRYAGKNKGLRRSIRTKYKSSKIQRTPSWVDKEKLRRVYEGCPDGFHVDHVVPLQGVLVSGLHVHYNLQYLPAPINDGKGNRFDLTAFNNDAWLKSYMGNSNG